MARPPSNLQGCLKAVQAQLNCVLGAARSAEGEERAELLAEHGQQLMQCHGIVKDLIVKSEALDGQSGIYARSDATFTFGYLEFLLDRPDSAVRHLRAAVSLMSPATEKEQSVAAERHFLLAQVWLHIGDDVAAEESLNAALACNPGYVPALIELMTLLGDRGDVAASYRLADGAAALRPQPLWVSPWQRPDHFMPGLEASPWHEASRFSWAATLEARAPEILRELKEVFQDPDAPRRGPCPAAGRGPEPGGWDRVGTVQTDDARAAAIVEGDGRWREFVFLGAEAAHAEQARLNCTRCPETARLLQSIPEVRELAAAGLGEALFSAISPGTRLKPHCGGTNARLTCHLGLLVPPTPDGPLPRAGGCMLSVGGEWRRWEEGRCLFFDDSFEHEVRYDAQSTGQVGACCDRVVLLLRFWHPDLGPERWGAASEHACQAVAQQIASQLPPLRLSSGEG